MYGKAQFTPLTSLAQVGAGCASYLLINTNASGTKGSFQDCMHSETSLGFEGVDHPRLRPFLVMRLLNVETLTLCEFFEQDVPPYGILSHRWGKDELSYQDFVQHHRKRSSGYKKISDFCAFVKKREHALKRDLFHAEMLSGSGLLEWVWIDTCCIDKTSSSEISEAINSVYSWYSNATECYVYMQDVTSLAETERSLIQEAFDRSEWFTRGWTLQEMLAPGLKVFCNSTWDILGHMFVRERSSDVWSRLRIRPWSVRKTLAAFQDYYAEDITSTISRITGVQMDYLFGTFSVHSASIACRMSWVAQRRTTRVEDIAYCVLGLFDVNMPLLYREGKKAFLRLQEEIIRRSGDQSVFLWSHGREDVESCTTLLTPDVRGFKDSGCIMKIGPGPELPFSITNIGVHLQMKSYQPAMRAANTGSLIHFLQLSGLYIQHWAKYCDEEESPTTSPYTNLIMLQCIHEHRAKWYRSRCNDLFVRGIVSVAFDVRAALGASELNDVEIYAPLYPSDLQQCFICKEFDNNLVAFIVSSNAQRAALG